jgi:hypothetical protein
MSADTLPTSDHERMRASDEDREATARVLGEAYMSGHLNVGDLRQRADEAYSATTWGALRKLTDDLSARPREDGLTEAHAPAPGHVGGPTHRHPYTGVSLAGLVWLAIAVAAPVPGTLLLWLLLLAAFALFALLANRRETRR